MNRRHRRQLSDPSRHRWLVSYADFITLLFAFFVVLYASSQVDKRKAGRLAVAIQSAFQELGSFPAFAVRIPPNANKPLALSPLYGLQNADLKSAAQAPQPPPEASSEESDPDLSMLHSQLQEALGREIAMDEIALEETPEGIVISMREFGFFESGSGTLKASALPTLDRIASLLAVRTYKMRVEGHTDNIPIHTAQFSSNWELSTARATEVVRVLMLRYRLDPERLAAAGYAQYHPLASNDTEQGRALNRRVDIVVLK
jgi:chemotaxis protein MotB